METLEGLPPHVSLWIEMAVVVLALAVLWLVLDKSLRPLTRRSSYIPLLLIPTRVALIGLGLLYIAQRISTHCNWEVLPHYMPALKKLLSIIVMTLLATGYTRAHLTNLAQRANQLGISTGKLRSINRLVQFSLYALAALLAIQAFGLNILPILTFGGIGIAALALASQDILSNFFGGVMVFLKRPFYEGDKVTIPSVSNFKGTVTQVGLYATVFRNESKCYSFFPNSLFCKSIIINESRIKQSLVKGIVTLPCATSKQLSALLDTVRQDIADDVEVTIDTAAFDDQMLSLALTFSCKRLKPEALIEKKIELFYHLQEIVAPHKGSVKLTS